MTKALDRLSPADKTRAQDALARGLVSPERLERAINRHLIALEAGRPSDLGTLLLQESAALVQSIQSVELNASHAIRAGRLGPYQLLGELGRGGMGVVYRARHAAPGSPEVALKVLNEGAGSEEWARFEREAITVARLRHPNVIPIVDYGEAHGRAYLALELVEGETLAERIKKNGPLAPTDAAEVAEQLARALAAAHAIAVLHRDLKPGNVLLRGRQALLTDFGLARSMVVSDERLTATGMVVGTPAYMAPEQVRGDEIDPRTDIYALGATLYEMLAGQPPFPGRSALATMTAVLEDEPAAPSRTRSGIDPALERICLRCLQKEPGLRYPDASTLAAELSRVVRGSSLMLRAPSILTSSLVALRLRVRRLAWALSVVAAALVGASLAVLAERRRGPPEGGPAGAPERAEQLVVRARLALAEGRRARAEGLVASALALAPDGPRALALRAELHAARGLLGLALADAARATAGSAPPAEALVVEARLRAWFDRPRALELARRAAAASPDDPAPLLLLARLEDGEASLRALRRALALAPGSSEAWELEAEAAEALGDSERARVALERRVGLAPPSARAWLRLGRLLSAAGKHEPAELALERALGLGIERVEGLLARARARLGRRAWARALDDLDQALALTPGAREPLLLRSRALFRLGRAREARADAESLTGRSPDDAEAWTALALGWLVPNQRGGDDLEARRQGRAALDKARRLREPPEPDWYRATALLELYEGRAAECERACTAALEQEPQDGWTLNLRGKARDRQGREAEAEADLRRGLSLFPEDGTGWVNLLTILSRRNDLARTQAALEEWLAAAPRSPELWRERGKLFLLLNRGDDALAALQEATRLDPQDPEAWTLQARLYLTANYFAEALRAADHALGVEPDLALARAVRGLALASLSRNTEARADLLRSLDLAPEASWASQVRQTLARVGPEPR